MLRTHKCLMVVAVLSGTVSAWGSPVLEQAGVLRERGDAEAELSLLKDAVSRDPSHAELVIALAQAYLRADNSSWAMRALSRYLDEHGPSCAVTLALAHLKIVRAEVREAQQLLDQSGCTAPPEVLARRQLLSAYVALLEERFDRTRAFLEEVRSSPRIFEEDESLLRYLTEATTPERSPRFKGAVNLEGGWTSQGLAGSPVDQTTRESSGTVMTVLGARLEVMLKQTGSIRPLVEGRVQAQELWSEQTADLSFRTGTGRLGVLLGRELPQLKVLGVLDATQTQGGDRYQDGPQWYAEGRRAELELEFSKYLFVMAGGGGRDFRDTSRTRTEIDGLVGWSLQHPSGTQSLSGVAARFHDARSDVHDLVGVSVMSQLRFGLGREFYGKVGQTVSLDDYFHSSDATPEAAVGSRRDLTWHATASVETPRWSSVQPALKYELTARRSSIQAYDYTDHRWLLTLAYSFDSDHLGQTLVESRGRAALEYQGLEGSEASSSQQLRELLRNEEQQRRSSTCQR